jgi:hypothetical protein
MVKFTQGLPSLGAATELLQRKIQVEKLPEICSSMA